MSQFEDVIQACARLDERLGYGQWNLGSIIETLVESSVDGDAILPTNRNGDVERRALDALFADGEPAGDFYSVHKAIEQVDKHKQADENYMNEFGEDGRYVCAASWLASKFSKLDVTKCKATGRLAFPIEVFHGALGVASETAREDVELGIVYPKDGLWESGHAIFETRRKLGIELEKARLLLEYFLRAGIVKSTGAKSENGYPHPIDANYWVGARLGLRNARGPSANGYTSNDDRFDVKICELSLERTLQLYGSDCAAAVQADDWAKVTAILAAIRPDATRQPTQPASKLVTLNSAVNFLISGQFVDELPAHVETVLRSDRKDDSVSAERHRLGLEGAQLQMPWTKAQEQVEEAIHSGKLPTFGLKVTRIERDSSVTASAASLIDPLELEFLDLDWNSNLLLHQHGRTGLSIRPTAFDCVRVESDFVANLVGDDSSSDGNRCRKLERPDDSLINEWWAARTALYAACKAPTEAEDIAAFKERFPHYADPRAHIRSLRKVAGHKNQRRGRPKAS